MIMTIMEMTGLFYEVIDKYTNKKDEIYKEYKPEFLSELEQMICDNIKDYDDQMTAAAMLCTCVVRYDLGEDYTDTALEVMENVLGRKDETLTHIVKGICENNFEEIDSSFEKEHCTVSKLLHFVRQMTYYYNYSDHSSDGYDYEKLFSALAKEFSEFDEDVQDYLLREGAYAKESLPKEFAYFDCNPVRSKWLLPYFLFESYKELLLNKFYILFSILEDEQEEDDLLDEQEEDDLLEDEIEGVLEDISELYDSDSDNSGGLSVWNTDKFEHDNSPALKNDKLHIPVCVPGMNNLRQRFKDRLERDRANEELEQASKDKNAVINDFTHTYGNMQATTLSDIANSLIGLDHDYFKELGRRLLVEFSIKENLTKEVDMLKLRFTDKTSELVDIIRKNSGNSCKNPVGINDIISGALSRCFFTLFYSTKKLGTTLRKIIFENDESDISDWRNSFEAEVIVGTTNSLDWNNTSGFIPLELKTSDLWDKLYVTNNEYAYLYLTEIFSELFINLMKYGSIDEDTPVELILGENGDTLTITITNKKNGNDIGYGTGKGLEIKRNLISKINNYFNIKDEPMIISETKNSFTVSISISKKLFNM